ncbi:MAG TPA: hypothetical protein VF681_05270 [Abditibacteriaceae bacterium]|jgi:hypothetical protein
MMKNHKINSSRIVALGTLSVMTLGTTAYVSRPAQAAGSSTWKKIAIGSAAVTGYGLLKRKKKVTTYGAVATVGSYYMYKRAKKKEARRRW